MHCENCGTKLETDENEICLACVNAFRARRNELLWDATIYMDDAKRLADQGRMDDFRTIKSMMTTATTMLLHAMEMNQCIK